jgi:hypothetical protein
VQNALAAVRETYNYFHRSSKRTGRLNNNITGGSKKRLSSVCATRWVERHEAILTFSELYPFVLQTLTETIDDGGGSKDAMTALALLNSISNSSFLVALCVLKKCLALTLPVAKGLQTPDQDLLACKELVDNVRSRFHVIRSTTLIETCNDIVNEAEQLCKMAGETLTFPRITGRQRHRANAPADSVDDYYRINFMIPVFDHL